MPNPPPSTPLTGSATCSSQARATITVGSVTVDVALPSPEELKRNITAGQAALKRAKQVLVTPGVKLIKKKGVPKFYASPETPGMIIREIDGRKSLGKFANGKFVRVGKHPLSRLKKATDSSA